MWTIEWVEHGGYWQFRLFECTIFIVAHDWELADIVGIDKKDWKLREPSEPVLKLINHMLSVLNSDTSGFLVPKPWRGEKNSGVA